MARPKKSEERDTRQDILEAALDLFAQDGFFGTSMRAIAREVGVRESALYHHFSSKDAILEGLMQSLGPGQARKLVDLDIGALLDAMGPREVLESLVQAMITLWTMPGEQKLLRLMMSEGHRLGVNQVLNLPRYMREARTHLARVFEAMQARKQLKKADPYALTLELMGPLMMLRVMYLVMPKGPPDLKGFHAEVKAHLDFFWSAVSKT
ncbi:MAG: TetR/AcrR family transcriptional regulator [Archangiaceae bacterium]|nr:TetR/AcrR family transcriptional regulator [Archangiaceae bacterium]